MKYLVVPFFLMILVSCNTGEAKQITIKEDVEFLASDKFEGRQTGSEGERKAAHFLASRFEVMELLPKGSNYYFQSFSFKPKTDPHQDVKYTVKDGDSTITGTNVIGMIDNQAEHTVVIGAHYDHLGYGAEGSLHRGETAIHNGADDNASGVGIMLNLAARLKEMPAKNNYLFIAFSGEEMGLLGSNYFVKNPTIDSKKISYMINMDMVGRLKEDNTLAVYGVGTSPIFKQTLNAHNEDFKLIKKESGVGPSDHTSFYNTDIPVLHFFTGQHSDYHKPSDDFEKLNYPGMTMISDYLFNIISDLDDNGQLPFRKTKNESEDVPRFKVGLGVTPDYLYDGEGMRIDGTREDTPATNAGLQKGDIVIKIGTHPTKDMMTYMKALATFNVGDTTTVTVNRAGKIIEAKLKF